MLPAYWRHSKPVFMVEGRQNRRRPNHHCGFVDWRQNGGIKWSLVFSMLPYVVHWVLSSTFLPIGWNQTSGTYIVHCDCYLLWMLEAYAARMWNKDCSMCLVWTNIFWFVVVTIILPKCDKQMMGYAMSTRQYGDYIVSQYKPCHRDWQSLEHTSEKQPIS